MVSKNESIFLGHTPADQRKYLTAVLKQFYDLGHSRIFLPAVGQFTLARCAIEAGFAKENIYTSDISLYSTLLGYYFAGRKVREIEFKVGDAWFDDYQLCQSDVERVAYLLWLMKVCQIRKVHYMKAQLEDLLINGEKHREILKGKVKAMKPYFAGVKYELQDMREVLTARYTHGDLVVVNPPVFSNGYTKMFDFGSDIEFDPNVPEFSFGKEYRDMYEQTLKSPAPFVWYRSRSVAGFDSEQVIYAKQYNVQKIDYWLCTKPELLKDWKGLNKIATFGRRELKPYKAPLFSDDDEITEDTRISFVTVPANVALYYRDLFAHKLWQTSGEHFFLMLLDGKVFATCAFMLSHMFRLQQDYVFENYGFNVSLEKYARANRLLMLAITCQEFGDLVHDQASRVNRYYYMKGLRTTCLSKYRKVKLNNGILTVEKRERMKDGMYKIMYQAEFRQETFADQVRRFLAEEVEFAKPKELVADVNK